MTDVPPTQFQPDFGPPTGFRRFKMTLAYRGSQYHGWQTQPFMSTYKGTPPPEGHGIPTIQEILTRTLRSVVDHPVIVSGSSRTDAGVHAKGQVAHFDTDKTQIPLVGLRRALNARLPADILIRDIEPAPPGFNAITWTTRKRYQYQIWHDEDRPVMYPDLAWHRWQPMDIEAVRRAAAQLVGTHDFESFAKPGHGKESTIRTVFACDVSYRKPRLIVSVEGSGFLWNMVRIIVGTLVEIGIGKYSADDVPKMLAAKDRKTAGGTAPPEGLYLQWIRFRESAEVVDEVTPLVPSPGTPGEG